MDEQRILQEMYSSAVIPVVAIENSEDAEALGRAFTDAGLKVIEITFRTAAAADSIRALTKSDLDIIVGAGTVLDTDMAQQAVEAGAQFLITPGFDETVVEWAVERQIPIFPGVTSPGEIAKAMKYKLSVLKFFPSESAGGISMLKALSGPYRSLKFIPTGGINQKNIGAYMELENVLACGGSWICPSSMISRHEFSQITELTREAVQNIHDFFLLHLGINSSDEQEAEQTAGRFGKMLGMPVKNGGSLFVGDMIEVNKNMGKGKNGHIAVSVRNINRAMAYFRSQGYGFDEENMPKDEKGIIAAYFTEEIGGFAVHLRRHL